MQITTFNPMILSSHADEVIALFEALGFERKHKVDNVDHKDITSIRMKDANGFHVDVTQGTGEWMMIRMNVDNLEEAIEFLEKHGFHKARHETANKTIDTGTSRINIMVSPSGFIFAVSEHTKDSD